MSMRSCLAGAVLLATLSSGVFAARDCDYATELVFQALDTRFPGDQRGLLEKALGACPDHPQANNNLGVVLEEAGDYPRALERYRRALRAAPELAEAWYGLGDVYRKQQRLPLALEAYLHACSRDAKRQVRDLLKENRYRVTEAGGILDKESLLALYDKDRQAQVVRLVGACGLPMRAVTERAATFRNFQFATGKAELSAGAGAQFKEIAAALVELDPERVTITGHTDRQPFTSVDQAESDRLNRRLSRDRAGTIRTALIARGVPAEVIVAQGHGPDQPLDRDHTPTAYAKNRRVEIKTE